MAHLPFDGEVHELQAHLMRVAELTVQFMPTANLLYKSQSFYVGLWHDIGKYNPYWQKRLFEVSEGKRNSTAIPHAHQGAYLAAQYGLMAAMCIYGHHRGLPDRGEFRRWITNPDRIEGTIARCEEAIAIARTEFPETWFLPENPFPSPTDWEEFDLMTRFLFSALIDADYTDTSEFYGATYPTLQVNWDAMIQQSGYSPFSSAERGLLSVCYPLSGFHLAALKFGLFHAQEHSLQRIVYAVPRAMLTAEVAREYRAILGDEFVLEHYISLAEKKTTCDRLGLLRLVSQNWDYPIVVTTVEQLLESLFSNRPEDCRKVHNLAESLIILEEIEFLPVGYVAPVMSMLHSLVQYGGASCVLGSSNPHIHDYLAEDAELTPLDWLGFQPQPHTYVNEFRSCVGEWSWEQVAQDIQHRKIESAVIVCHSPVQTQSAIAALSPVLDYCYGLSTLMCSAHRQSAIETVRQRLSSNAPAFLITHVVGSNLGMSFPHAYLNSPPLEVIRQATILLDLYESLTVFSLTDEKYLPPRSRETQMLLSQGLSLGSDEIDREYIWHRRRGRSKDQYSVQKMRQLQQFRATSQHFRLKPDTTAVFIAYDDAATLLLEQLESKPNWTPADFLSIQPYLVDVPDEGYLVESRTTKQGLCVWTGLYCSVLGLMNSNL